MNLTFRSHRYGSIFLSDAINAGEQRVYQAVIFDLSIFQSNANIYRKTPSIKIVFLILFVY